MLHVASDNVELGGYVIPKGAHITANIHSAHMDPAAWDQPEKFLPERWIDTEGRPINHAAYMPFSLGEYVLTEEKAMNLKNMTMLYTAANRAPQENPFNKVNISKMAA